MSGDGHAHGASGLGLEQGGSTPQDEIDAGRSNGMSDLSIPRGFRKRSVSTPRLFQPRKAVSYPLDLHFS